MRDVATVGGKNASLGEMIGSLGRLGVQVPGGFATTAHAYREFLEQGALEARLRGELSKLDVDDVARLAATGARIRRWIPATPLPPALTAAVSAQLQRMSAGGDLAVAVRSSATAEDLPEASFAGQQESFLNVRGEAEVLKAMHEVFASLFNDRAISYRVHQGFDHAAVALSAGVQHMVRSDLGASGVMFTLDTDSGFREVVLITAAWGLGETVVQGAVNPDEFYVYKPALRAGKLAILRRNLGAKAVKMVYAPAGSPARVQTVAVPPADRRRFCLSDADIVTLARQALIIEEHYGRPMDIEWARDGASGAIVTNRGGRTCHAAIIARELGIPAVVGCGDATQRIREGQEVTVSCAEGDTGHVYEGLLQFERTQIELDALPKIPVKIMMNVGNPERAFDFANIPHRGVGLARLEFIINRMIGVHPRALLEFDRLDAELQEQIRAQMAGYSTPVDFYVEKLAEGIAQIAAAFAPEPVIVRLSDFKSNEYANLIGGSRYEPQEENPMLGFRGAARYVDETFRPCFELECRALKRAREAMGLGNVQVMVPFVRSLAEARQVTALLAQNGLQRREHGLKVIMMCELPTNALLAEQYLEHFDGMSIGSNDMTQLTLGLDRDSAIMAGHLVEGYEPARQVLALAASASRKQRKYVGICRPGPADHPDLARWLLDQGIESMSLNPDTVVETWLFLAQAPAPGPAC